MHLNFDNYFYSKNVLQNMKQTSAATTLLLSGGADTSVAAASFVGKTSAVVL